MFCQNCGNKSEENEMFCTKCGTLLAQPMTAGMEEPKVTKKQKTKKKRKKGVEPFLIYCGVVFIFILWMVASEVDEKKSVYSINKILPTFFSNYEAVGGTDWDFCIYDKKGNITKAVKGQEIYIVEYDKKGNVTEWKALDGRSIYRCEYASGGKLEKVVSYDYLGNVIEMWNFGYDPNRSMVYMVHGDKNGVVGNLGEVEEFYYDRQNKTWNYKHFLFSLTKEIVIDKQGKLLKTVEYASYSGDYQLAEYEYEYDDRGNLSKLSWYDAKGLLCYDKYTYDDENRMIKSKRIYSKSDSEHIKEYEYDKSGNVVKVEDISWDGEQVIIYKYEYDKSGNVVMVEQEDEKGDLESTTKYEYEDSNLCRIESRTYVDSELSIATTEWDSQGKLQKEVYESPWDKGDIEYEYDTKGNIIKEVSIREEGINAAWHVKHVTEREYEYEYDEQGNMTKCEVEELEENIYDSRENDTFPADWEYEYEYEYDSKGNVVSKTEYWDGEKNGKYEYNLEGLLIRVRNGGYNYRREYGESGNVIEAEDSQCELAFSYSKGLYRIEKKVNEDEELSGYYTYHKENNHEMMYLYFQEENGESIIVQDWGWSGQLSEYRNYDSYESKWITSLFEYDDKGYLTKIAKYDEYSNLIVEEEY